MSLPTYFSISVLQAGTPKWENTKEEQLSVKLMDISHGYLEYRIQRKASDEQ